jgi:hypothetical protein
VQVLLRRPYRIIRTEGSDLMKWYEIASPRLKKPRKRRVYHEDNECSTFVEQLSWEHPDVYKMLTKIEQGGSRGAAESAKLKKLGLKAGFPDYFLFLPRGKYHGLAIEMKRPADATPNKPVTSDAQYEWQYNLRDNNYAAYICYSAEEAIDTVKKYLKLGPPPK